MMNEKDTQNDSDNPIAQLYARVLELHDEGKTEDEILSELKGGKHTKEAIIALMVLKYGKSSIPHSVEHFVELMEDIIEKEGSEKSIIYNTELETIEEPRPVLRKKPLLTKFINIYNYMSKKKLIAPAVIALAILVVIIIPGKKDDLQTDQLSTFSGEEAMMNEVAPEIRNDFAPEELTETTNNVDSPETTDEILDELESSIIENTPEIEEDSTIFGDDDLDQVTSDYGI